MQKGPFQVNWHASGSELGTHPDPLRPTRGRTKCSEWQQSNYCRAVSQVAFDASLESSQGEGENASWGVRAENGPI